MPKKKKTSANPRKKKNPPPKLSEKTPEPNTERKESKGTTEKAVTNPSNQCQIYIPCITLWKQDPTKRVMLSDIRRFYIGLRQEQRTRLARIENHLNSEFLLKEFIEEELARYKPHNNRSMVPSRLGDVAEILMPDWKPAMEKAAVSWVGDWRPSSIFRLVQIFCRMGFMCLSERNEKRLKRAFEGSHIEEIVLDDEMAEYQAYCVLYLPFAGLTEMGSWCSSSWGKLKKKKKKMKKKEKREVQAEAVKREMKKIGDVIIKAQLMRYKAIEMVVKRLLTQTQAAQFLVAFAGIQDMINQFASARKLLRGAVSIIIESHFT